MKLAELTITQAADGLRKKEFSALELVSDCLRAVKEKNGELNAFLTVFEDEAVAEAKRADELLRDPHTQAPALCGIPFALKDNILLEGRRATAGSKILENYTAPYDATVVTRLKNHGAVFVGKTNLDEFAMGSSTENSGYGPTRHPLDVSRVPGGSSGGSAVAVSAGMALGALGSDTGGSIRQPASFCGLVGFKPTYGTVSRHGLMAMASSLDQIGPLARSVSDAELVFKAISGGDPFDSTCDKSYAYRIAEEGGDLHGVRIGVPKEYFVEGIDPDVKDSILSAIKKCEGGGAAIEEISLPHAEYALPAYYIVVPSEVSANLARFDGVRYGLQAHGKNLLEVYEKTRAHGFGAEVKRRIMLGTYALSAGYYDAFYIKAQKVRRLIRQDFKNAFEKVDIIMGPTTPTPAFKLGERADDPLQMYLADIYTVAMPIAGLPALSMPASPVVRDGVRLPVGLQLTGPWFKEQKLFSIAKATETLIKN